MADAFKIVSVVHAGYRLLTGGKLGICILPAGGKMDADTMGSYFIEKGSGLSGKPGGLYQVEAIVNDVGRISNYRPGTAQWIGPADVPADVLAGWEAETEAAKLVLRTRQRQKALEADTPLRHTLDDLRAAYRKVTPQFRTAFVAWLLEEIRR